MDSVLKSLKKENICPKCHFLLDLDENYDKHVNTCDGSDPDIISTTFHTKDEIVYKESLLKRKKSLIFNTTFIKTDRPATR